MKTTEFERTITVGVAGFISFIERTLDTGSKDPNVSFEVFEPAFDMRNEIATAIEKYSRRILKLHGYED